jgi:hypothetical protein
MICERANCRPVDSRGYFRIWPGRDDGKALGRIVASARCGKSVPGHHPRGGGRLGVGTRPSRARALQHCSFAPSPTALHCGAMHCTAMMQSCNAPTRPPGASAGTMRIKVFEDEPLVAFPNVLSSLVFTERDRTKRIRGRSATGAVLCGRPVLTRSVKE